MEEQEFATMQLRAAVESTIGRALKTPKDFDALSESVFEKTHERISASTLRRFWGYQHDAAAAPRVSTLDILSRFVGYDSWDDFCKKTSEEKAPSHVLPSSEEAEVVGKTPTPKRKKRIVIAAAFAVAAIIFILYLFSSPSGDRRVISPSHHILHMGDRFTSYDDYLKLFGVKSDEYRSYWVAHPEHPYIMLWGPVYKHHVYHNEGDSATLCPTITTYWLPENYPTDTASMATFERINKQRYIDFVEHRQILLTFMQNLVDSNFVFLGAYRLSTTLSDSTHAVFRRVMEDVDIDNLEILYNYRF